MTMSDKPTFEEMLEALKAQHRAIDVLMAALIWKDKEFMPTQSSVWPSVVLGAETIRRAEGGGHGD